MTIQKDSAPVNCDSCEIQEFVKHLTVHYGSSTDSMQEFFQDMEWAKAHRRTMNRVGTWAAGSITTAVAGGLLLALWEGFKHLAGK